MSQTWKYAVSFSNEGDTIEFIHQPKRVTFVEELVSTKLAELLLLRGWNPVGWKIWSAVINWVHKHETVVHSIPADVALLTALVPLDQWLWDDEVAE